MTPDLSTPEGKLVERLKPAWAVDEPVGRAVSVLRFTNHDLAEKLNAFLVANNTLKSEAADALSRIAAERDEARLLVTEANNSLYGSQGYFHSLDGGTFDKYHLANGIEKIKAYGREQWRKTEAAERERDELKAEVERLREVLKGLYRGFVNSLENGRDRIIFLGGDCDPVDVMERGHPDLAAARAALRTPEESP